MEVRWGNDGDGKHWDRRGVRPEHDSQEEDHEALQVSKVSMTEQRHKGEEPGLVSPTNDATLPTVGSVSSSTPSPVGTGEQSTEGKTQRGTIHEVNRKNTDTITRQTQIYGLGSLPYWA